MFVPTVDVIKIIIIITKQIGKKSVKNWNTLDLAALDIWTKKSSLRMC